jgi:hypothetical protein
VAVHLEGALGLLLVLTALKLVCEIALLSLAGQGLLHVLAGAGREANVFYQLLRVMTRPFTAAVRRLTPRRVLDRHVPLATFGLLLLAWVVVTVEKVRLCVNIGMQACT